ncbi:unnamed protein product [Medioppia subpectinata]|uniref:Fucosyltransferase n=1 Tax=Medioppia subpectinata TaxID=1979941 RepID=A0A7R9KXC9_9ACAR|nr:unnamed protein product [Medioppia subpectinata]CAG2111592.1 unnamed protein product [Medioppia subpectinata]
MKSIKYILIVVILLVFLLYTLNWSLLNVTDYHISTLPAMTDRIKDQRLKTRQIDTNDGFNNQSNARQYLILLWTKYYFTDDWSQLDYKSIGCQFSNCLLSEDQSLVESADAVLFHWRDTDPQRLPAKTVAAVARGQKWVLFNWESPEHSRAGEHGGRDVHSLVNHIDWFMNYRRDSDIYVPYGSVTKCVTKWQNEDLFDGKSASVAWIVSNCHTPCNRETYVNDLRKHIDIDIFGKCGQHDCPQDGTCLSAIVKKYKFFLSFENSLCKDYVTEKLFKYASYDIIPVVYGSADYSLIMPNNSFINVKDFNTTEDLAKYLKLVSSDKQLYNSYMLWKKSYCSQFVRFEYFCNLCQKLNEDSARKPTNRWNRTNLIEWYTDSSDCRRPTFNSGFRPIVFCSMNVIAILIVFIYYHLFV